MRFTTTVELAGRTATVAGYTYRSTVASMGGRFLVPLSAEHRTASGIAAGDEVEVDLELDTAPRVLEVPDDLAAAIAADPAAPDRKGRRGAVVDAQRRDGR